MPTLPSRPRSRFSRWTLWGAAFLTFQTGLTLQASALAAAPLPPPPTTAPRAILFRLVQDTATVVGTLDGTPAAPRWTPGEALGPLARRQIGSRVQATVLGPGGRLGTATVGGPVSSGDPCDWVRETPFSSAVRTVFPAHALTAPWNPVPRPITALPLNSAPYLAVAQAELRKRGVTAPARLVQLFRVDLDGNGRDDIVMAAASDPLRFEEGVMMPTYTVRAGQYSLVLVREALAGGVKTSVLGDRVQRQAPTEDAFPTVMTQRIGAIADINGDGRMEVLVDDYVHEGEGTTVWQSQPGNAPMKKILEWGCGV